MKRFLIALIIVLFAVPCFATVTIETNRVQYNCNGTTTAYTYPFKILEDDDLLVITANSAGSEATLTLNTDYTVAGEGTSTGGTMTLTAGSKCPSGSTLTMLRNIELTQDTDYVDGEAFSAESLEGAIDKTMLIQQQQQEELDRSIKVERSSTLTNLTVIPQAGKTIGFNAAGTGITTYSTTAGYASADFANITDYGATVSAAITAIGLTETTVVVSSAINLGGNTTIPANVHLVVLRSGAITTTGYTLTFTRQNLEAGLYQIFAGTGTVTGLSEARPEWWGGKADGSTDNTTAFIAAVDSLGGGSSDSTANGGTVILDKGIYNFDSALPFTDNANVHVVGQGTTYMNGFKIPATSIRYIGTAATFMSFIGNYARGWYFKDLAIEYSSSSFTGTLVDIQTPGITFDNVSFGGTGYAGTMSDTFTAQYLVKLATFESIVFNKCQFQKAKKGIYINDAAGSGSGPLTINQSIFYTLTEAFIEQLNAGNYSINLTGNVFDVSIDAAGAQISGNGIILKSAGMNITGNEFSGYVTRTPTGAFLYLLGGSGTVTGNKFRTNYTGILVDSFTGDISANDFDAKLPLDIRAGSTLVTGKGNMYRGINTPSMAVSIGASYAAGYATVDLGPDFFYPGSGATQFATSYNATVTGGVYINGIIRHSSSTDGSTSGATVNGLGNLIITEINGATNEMLLSTTTIALNADADTTIYTVPAGRRCVLTKAILVAGANANSTDFSIGADGSETDWLPTNQLDNLDAQYDAVILMPVPNTTPTKIKSYAATTVIQAKVSNQAGGATNTLYLFGILY